MTKFRATVVLVLAMGLISAGCSSPTGYSAAQQIANDPDNWSYVKGPHGENCLVLSANVGFYAGLMAMSCDNVNPGK